MSACWLRQKQLSFDSSSVDYITCSHFAVLPVSENNNNNNVMKEVLYVGCNNGSVIACDISSISQQTFTTTHQNPDEKSVNVSKHLTTLYKHGKVIAKPPKKNNIKNDGDDDDDDASSNIVNDELSGASVFALAQYETLFASCADDSRCVISMMPESHPPFMSSKNANRRRKDTIIQPLPLHNKKIHQHQQQQQQENNIVDLDFSTGGGLVAVIEETAPIRAVSLFGGRKSWNERFGEEEESKVYCATGSEDGYLRVYRIDVEAVLKRMISQDDAKYAENHSHETRSFSFWAEELSSTCDLIWVVSCSSSIFVPLKNSFSLDFSGKMKSETKVSSTPLNDEYYTLARDPNSSTQTGGDNNNNNNLTPKQEFICSLVFDEVTELFVVGTQSSCCLVECCCPQSQHPSQHGNEERDLKIKATSEKWLNEEVWALSKAKLLTLKGVPLRSLKSKYLSLYAGGRSIGSVVDVVDADETEESSSKTTSMIKVMFPSLHHKKKAPALSFPQEALRRIERPKYFLTTNGGPYFSTCIIRSQQQNENLLVAIAGAAFNGEVCLVSISKQTQNVSVEGTVDISLLCRFRAGNDLIKNISCAVVHLQKNRTTKNPHPESFFLLCSSYDGTFSDWNLILDNEQEENGKISYFAQRRCVQLVACVDNEERNEKLEKLKSTHQKISDEMLLLYPNLLLFSDEKTTKKSSSNNDDDEDEGRNHKNNLLPQQQFEQQQQQKGTAFSGVGSMFFFPEANVIFASCLFERTMQTFLFARREGPFELPEGMIFNGFKTVTVVSLLGEHNNNNQEQKEEKEGAENYNWERVGIPIALEEEAKSLESKNNKKVQKK